MFEAIILRSRQNPLKTKLKPSFEIDWGEKFEKADFIKREKGEIGLFDLKTFVNDARKNVLINNTTNPFNIDPFGSEPFSNKDLVPFEGGGSNIDNLIKNIDKKLEELEQEEYKDIKTNINKSESELAKLKIDD